MRTRQGSRYLHGRKPRWAAAFSVGLILLAVASFGTWTVVRRRREESTAKRAAGEAAARYLAAWSRQDYGTMATLTGSSSASMTRFSESAVRELGISAAEYRLTDITVRGRSAYAGFTASLSLGHIGRWNYPGRLQLTRARHVWRVDWSPASWHPGLRTGDSLALTSTAGTRGHVTDDTGQPLRQADPSLTTSVLGPAPAASTSLQGAAATSPSDAALSQRYQQMLVGRPTVQVVAVDAAGQQRLTLKTFAGTPGRNLATTFDTNMQRQAEQIVAGSSLPTSLVAIDTRTGAVKAAADNSAAAPGTALAGRFPPGSTFKIVTATAALEHGYTLSTPVDCPATREAGGFVFHNAAHEALGVITFERAFAVSCNTAFINIAESLPAGALARAAAFYGCTSDTPAAAPAASLPVPAFTCNYPAASGTAYAASAFGQAQDEVSPLGMTMICAAAASGTWRAPSILEKPSSNPAARNLPPQVVAELHTAMRAVVTQGTATSIAATAVAGKTGTAEYGSGNPPPTHAWFTGYLGHYAVTVLVQDGGYGGDVAAPLAAHFLGSLPQGP